MANLTDAPSFTANEVYQIQATDPVEGAAAGASFSGNGIDNEPHQRLANRTAFLKGRQDTNIANIGTLLAFMNAFSGKVAQNGYLKIPYADTELGASTFILQWGWYQLSAQVIPNDQIYTISWNIPFPSLCAIVLANNVYSKTSGFNTVASPISWDKSGGTFVLDVPGGTSLGDTKEKSNGFTWYALGR